VIGYNFAQAETQTTCPTCKLQFYLPRLVAEPVAQAPAEPVLDVVEAIPGKPARPQRK
jgi:hypothetical protein